MSLPEFSHEDAAVATAIASGTLAWHIGDSMAVHSHPCSWIAGVLPRLLAALQRATGHCRAAFSARPASSGSARSGGGSSAIAELCHNVDTLLALAASARRPGNAAAGESEHRSAEPAQLPPLLAAAFEPFAELVLQLLAAAADSAVEAGDSAAAAAVGGADAAAVLQLCMRGLTLARWQGNSPLPDAAVAALLAPQAALSQARYTINLSHLSSVAKSELSGCEAGCGLSRFPLVICE